MRVKTIDCNTASKNQLPYPGLICGQAYLLSSFYIHLLIAREWAHVIAVFSGEVNYGVGTLDGIANGVDISNVTFLPDFRKSSALADICEPDSKASVSQERCEAGTDKA